MTRTLLTALINGTPIAEFQPQNNKQAYLAYLCGADITLPEPRSAEEALLYNLCLKGGVGGGNGGDGGEFTITNCDYLFYNGARSDIMSELFKRIPYIESAANMFSSFDSENDINDMLPNDFVTKLKKSAACQNMFYNSSGVKSFPSVTFETPTVLNSMFAMASKLKSVGDIYAPSILYNGLQNVFSNASALESVGNITIGDETPLACGSMFQGARSLKSIGKLNFKPSNANQMFSGCYELEDIPDIDLSECQDIGNLFSSCGSLKGSITMGKTKVESSVSYVFNKCIALEEILDFYVSTSGNAFGYDCFPRGTESQRAALKRLTFHPEVKFTGFYQFNISYCSFERDGMVELFNSLPSIVGSTASDSYKTITITGNPCITDGTLTAEDRAIATNKGWTLVEG